MNKKSELIWLKPDEIGVDPDLPNIRGKVHDTTDIQASTKSVDGIEKSIWVRIGEDGQYLLIDGARRLTAAKRLGLELVPVTVKDVDVNGARRLMLISDMQKPLPHLVLENGRVVAGKAFAVHQELKTGGMKKYQLAEMMGIKPDIVGAYDRLCTDILPVQERVAAGLMEITVYSLIKRRSVMFKDYLLSKTGRVTADRVRRLKKQWPTIKAELLEGMTNEPIENDDADGFDDQDEMAQPMPESEEYPIARCINEAMGWLNRIDGRVFGPSEYHLLERLKQQMEEF